MWWHVTYSALKRKKKSDRIKDNAMDARDMPPPTVPTFVAGPTDSTASQGSNMTQQASYGRPEALGKPLLTPANKKAGFKPIGQASSSLKRFFPGEDDDDDEEAEIKIHRPSASAAAESSSLKSKPSPPSSQHSEQAHARDINLRVDQNGASYETRADTYSAQSTQHHALDQPPSPMIISPIPSQHHQDVRRSDRRDSYREQEKRVPGIPRSKPGSGYAEDVFGDPSMHGPDATMPPTPDQGNEEFYRIVSQVGEGTFGKVYKARNSSTGQFVALKRIRMEAERDGFPVTAMREIKLLQSLRHENVVRLYEMMVSNG